MSKKRIGKKGYIVLGIVSAIISLFFFPPVFGAISILCAFRVVRKYERIGIFIGILGIICLLLGMFHGAVTDALVSDYPNTYSKNRVYVHYDNLDQKYVGGLVDYFSKNSSSGTDIYVEYENGRYYVGYTTIFSSAGEIPQNYDYTFQSRANEISKEVFGGQPIILKVLNTRGDVLKRYPSS